MNSRSNRVSGTDAIARRLKDLLCEISPLIEEYTGKVCPLCHDVCCKQRHAFPERKDLVFLSALGAEADSCDKSRSPDDPCEFLGRSGCAKPRWMRPLRCTWYFCGPLLTAMEEGPQRRYRKLIAMMGEMVGLSNELQTRQTTE